MSDFSKMFNEGIKKSKECAKEGADKVSIFFDMLGIDARLQNAKYNLAMLYCEYGKKVFDGEEAEELKSEIVKMRKIISDIEDELEDTQAEFVKETSEVVYCSKCGAKLETSDFFCKKCGTKIKKF